MFWGGSWESLVLSPDLCGRSALAPTDTMSSFLITSAFPSAAFAAKGALTISSCTSKVCHRNSLLRPFLFSFMFLEYSHTLNNLVL